MADALTLELVSPERRLVSAKAEAVTIPGIEGDLTAMVTHAPFLTTLRPGYVVLRNGATEERYFVTGGFAEISDDVVSVLTEAAVGESEVTSEWLDARIAEAEKAAEEAGEERVQAARQRLSDFQVVRQTI